MAKISPTPIFRALDSNGDPLSGGKLYTYEAGTTTPKVTFTDSNEGTPNTNPIILDADGYANVWLDDGAYKFVLDDVNDVQQWEVDDIVGDASTAFGSSVITQSSNLNVTSVFNNNVILCTTTLTLTLLSAAVAGEGFYITVKNTGSGVVTVDPDGAETIDGVSTLDIEAGSSAIVICNGTSWQSLFLSVPFSVNGYTDTTITLTDEIAFGDVSDSNEVKKDTVQGIVDLVPEIDINAQPSATVTGTDEILFGDVSDSNALKKTTAQDIADLAPSSFTPSYESAQTSYTNGTTVTFTHGLGAIPELYTVEAVCLTAEAGIAVGERFNIMQYNNAANNPINGFVSATSTQIKIYISGNALSVSTGSGFATITPANFRLIAKGWI